MWPTPWRKFDAWPLKSVKCRPAGVLRSGRLLVWYLHSWSASFLFGGTETFCWPRLVATGGFRHRPWPFSFFFFLKFEGPVTCYTCYMTWGILHCHRAITLWIATSKQSQVSNRFVNPKYQRCRKTPKYPSPSTVDSISWRSWRRFTWPCQHLIWLQVTHWPQKGRRLVHLFFLPLIRRKGVTRPGKTLERTPERVWWGTPHFGRTWGNELERFQHFPLDICTWNSPIKHRLAPMPRSICQLYMLQLQCDGHQAANSCEKCPLADCWAAQVSIEYADMATTVIIPSLLLDVSQLRFCEFQDQK